MPSANAPDELSEFRRRALSRWENEGGAVAAVTRDARTEVSHVTNTALIQLRIRPQCMGVRY